MELRMESRSVACKEYVLSKHCSALPPRRATLYLPFEEHINALVLGVHRAQILLGTGLLKWIFSSVLLASFLTTQQTDPKIGIAII
jgi:hypothetical protein